ncbi:glycosyltransferase [Flavobacteriaceae bacterium]|nr:glycosyltransferase [Flavobacteriaceae bacterium]MDC1309995.1 glycosyltransferase [Flavobacteriaceae bacterium]
MSNIIILIPHFNNLSGLQRTIGSIKEEPTPDILVIDDGSKEKLVKSSIKYSGRVFFKFLKANSGIGIALNVGLDFAVAKKYEYTGRLDCGDLCHVNKFTKQLNYLSNNKDIKLLGSWARIVDDKGVFMYNLKHPVDYETIQRKMYQNSMFIHPTVIIRTEIISKTGKYPVKYRRAAQDYAFFFNIIRQFKSENYPEILLDYVMSKNSISHKNRKLQVYHRIRILIDNFYFGLTPIYSIIRNLILLIIPVKILTFIKSKTYK